MNTTTEKVYLKKSVTFYKIYGGVFLFAIFMSIIVRPFMKSYSELLDLLVGLPVLSVFIMAPFGLYYSWKSYKRKEGLPTTRTLYLMGHLFFCLLVVLFISITINDISKLF